MVNNINFAEVQLRNILYPMPVCREGASEEARLQG